MQGIYVIFNRISKKIYIGSSINIKQRFNDHRKRLRRGDHDNTHLQRSWNKHREASFKFSILECVTDSQNLLAREQFWINKIKPKFNILKKAGNSLGFRHSEETKKRLSFLASQKTGERNVWFGRGLPKQVLDKAAAVCSKKFKGEGNPFFGKEHSLETRVLISEKLTGRKMSESFSKKQTGNERGALEYIVTFPNGETSVVKNLMKFCREHGLIATNAYVAIQKSRPYRGYMFRRN